MAEANTEVVQEEKRDPQKHDFKAYLFLQSPLHFLVDFKLIFKAGPTQLQTQQRWLAAD